MATTAGTPRARSSSTHHQKRDHRAHFPANLATGSPRHHVIASDPRPSPPTPPPPPPCDQDESQLSRVHPDSQHGTRMCLPGVSPRHTRYVEADGTATQIRHPFTVMHILSIPIPGDRGRSRGARAGPGSPLPIRCTAYGGSLYRDATPPESGLHQHSGAGLRSHLRGWRPARQAAAVGQALPRPIAESSSYPSANAGPTAPASSGLDRWRRSLHQCPPPLDHRVVAAHHLAVGCRCTVSLGASPALIQAPARNAGIPVFSGLLGRSRWADMING